MSAADIFAVANAVALAGWILLATLPRSRWVADTLCARVLPALFAALYVAILGSQATQAEGGFSSLSEVERLFSNPWLLLAGWVHYLAFDLLIGTWEVRDARERGIRHLWVVPCLVLTFMLGPAGWLLYMGVRRAQPPPG